MTSTCFTVAQVLPTRAVCSVFRVVYTVVCNKKQTVNCVEATKKQTVEFEIYANQI